MRMSLARPCACMTLKNIVFGACRPPVVRTSSLGMGLPQLPQNLWAAGTMAPHPGQARSDCAVTEPTGGVTRVGAPETPRPAPQVMQDGAPSALYALQASQTSPR